MLGYDGSSSSLQGDDPVHFSPDCRVPHRREKKRGGIWRGGGKKGTANTVGNSVNFVHTSYCIMSITTSSQELSSRSMLPKMMRNDIFVP